LVYPVTEEDQQDLDEGPKGISEALEDLRQFAESFVCMHI